MLARHLPHWLCCAGAVLSLATPLLAQDPLSREAITLRLKQTSQYLAADELEGRGINTAGIDKAADYLAAEFTRMGLDTKRYQGTPFHTFYLGSRFGLGKTNSLVLTPAGGKPTELAMGADFTPLSLSGSGKLNLPVAFMGYGITAPKHNYDDYAGIDVAGHAVIVLRNEPRKTDVNSPFDGAQPSEFAVLSHKVLNAIEHQAAAVLLVTDSASLPTDAGDDPAKTDPLLPFLVKSNVGNRQIPIIHCRRVAVEPLLRSAGKLDLVTLEQGIDSDLKPRSMRLPGSLIAGEISLVRTGTLLKNVIAVLPGSGPHAEETLILGAHYDHLGFGGAGSLAFTNKKEIHNGADDNGSGTSVLIEAARQLTLRHAKQPPARRIVFIAFTAEESGLIGSERYVKDPLFPLNQTVAMLNLDMVGRLRQERLTVYGTGTATEFDPLIDRLGTKHAFSIVKKPGGYGPSDHASFHQRSIPVLHFFTGLHKQYHRPEDDSDLLNVEGMTRISQMVVDTIEELAAAKQRPTPQKVSGSDDIEGLAEALLGGTGDSGETARTPLKPGTGQPYLGLSSRKGAAPDDAGLKVERVTRDGPAANAGIRSGDLILKIGADPIHTFDDLTATVKKFKSGQKVTVQLRRAGVDLEVEATLGGR